jgi:hypothetical protein
MRRIKRKFAQLLNAIRLLGIKKDTLPVMHHRLDVLISNIKFILLFLPQAQQIC